jgi:hypothetical protein
MALVTYLIGPCVGGASINVDFNSASLPTVGGNYFLRFTGATTEGCYEILDTAEPGDGTDVVSFMSTNYGDCVTCQAVVTPTPTASTTPTPTPTVTRTASVTPTTTPTPSVTPTQTGTPAVTPTTTNTPTASSFGTNTFRVDIVDAGRARTNSYSLTEIPYDTTPGSGFTASTGTFPITAGGVVFGTHQAFSSSVNNYITFEMTCVIDGELSIVAFVNGGFVRSQGPYNLVSSGPNTITFYFPITVSESDTLRFQLS